MVHAKRPQVGVGFAPVEAVVRERVAEVEHPPAVDVVERAHLDIDAGFVRARDAGLCNRETKVAQVLERIGHVSHTLHLLAKRIELLEVLLAPLDVPFFAKAQHKKRILVGKDLVVGVCLLQHGCDPRRLFGVLASPVVDHPQPEPTCGIQAKQG